MLRVPTLTLATATIATTGASSAKVYFPVMDFTGVVAKLTMTTVTSSALESVQVYFQTTDDGGTTWFDMAAATAITSASTMTNAASQWFTFPVDVATAIDKPTLSDATLTTATTSGLPILSNSVRVKWTVSGTLTSMVGSVVFYANNQSQHA